MLDYYARRAAEYESVYAKPERQADLARLRLLVAERMAGRDVLEIACGTGYWTEIFSPFARSVTATDLSEEMLAVARGKILPANRVTFLLADGYSLDAVPGNFNAAFAGFWWSHIPRHRVAHFLEGLGRRLAPASRVLVIDNVYVEGSSTPISRTDDEGNTYQTRRLGSGESFEVLKNFPTEAELLAAIAPFSAHVEVTFFQYYWALCYETIAQ